MNIEIANRLVNLRKGNNLSQEALAEKLGISRQAVSKWERAEASPDTDNLILLSRLYGISLDELLKNYQVVHLCGKGKLEESLQGKTGYIQFEYIKDELKDLFAMSQIIISRAGANAICEILALKKPNILIPLSANASRGDQILNADSFKKQGYSEVLKEEELTSDILIHTVNQVYKNKTQYIRNMDSSPLKDSVKLITDLIDAAANS